MKLVRSAGGLVVSPDGKVLVVNQNGDSWSLPKGHIDAGETALRAARREIAEESGITELRFYGRLGSYTRTRLARGGGEDITQKKFLVFFAFRTRQIRLNPTDPHNPEARWVEPGRVEALLTHPKDKAFFARAWKKWAAKHGTGVYSWKSPLGWLRIECRDRRVVRMGFVRRSEGDPAPAWLSRLLKKGFAQGRFEPLARLARPSGTAFQMKVWRVVSRIPRGRTLSYAQVARKAGRPAAIRAAASAVGANPVCPAIPCHRVVASDGSLGGYAYGVRLKAALLKREGVRL